jgi:hypothetical protein
VRLHVASGRDDRASEPASQRPTPRGVGRDVGSGSTQWVGPQTPSRITLIVFALFNRHNALCGPFSPQGSHEPAFGSSRVTRTVSGTTREDPFDTNRGCPRPMTHRLHVCCIEQRPGRGSGVIRIVMIDTLCAKCGDGRAILTLLTSFVQYYRCDACGHLWHRDTVESPVGAVEPMKPSRVIAYEMTTLRQ